MSPDTMWIIGTLIALAGVLFALARSVNTTIATGLAGVHKRIDDVRADLARLHEDHIRLEERLRMTETRPNLGLVQTREAE